jgi:hypothetical protein
LIITNHTDKDIEFGAQYSIEKLENESWVKIPVRFFTTLMRYRAAPGHSVRIPCTLDPSANPNNNTYEYESGKYRIAKSVMTKNGDVELYYEFEI